MENKQTKGFTLIELLVVIGIVAILSAVVILTLNPAELLKQSRDSNRISDMSTLKSAISLYLADVTTPHIGTSTNCYISLPSAGTQNASSGGAAGTCGGLFTIAATTNNVSSSNPRAVDKTGWIPVKFTDISSGSPVGNLPVDPSNTTLLYYAYKVDTSLNFEIDVAQMESLKFRNGGASDIVSTDGGNHPTAYEVGTAPGLAL